MIDPMCMIDADCMISDRAWGHALLWSFRKAIQSVSLATS
jgi:hypothetical protein